MYLPDKIFITLHQNNVAGQLEIRLVQVVFRSAPYCLVIPDKKQVSIIFTGHPAHPCIIQVTTQNNVAQKLILVIDRSHG